MSTVAGLDLSLTCSGLVALRSDGTHDVESMRPTKLPKKVGKGLDVPELASAKMRRLVEIRAGVREFISEYSPRIVCLEGYAFSAQMAHSLGECGGAVKTLLWERGIDFYIVPPTTLKKFASSDGRAEKGMMIKEVFKRWGFEARNDNEADAYACARIADLLLNGSAVARAKMLKTITYVPGRQ